MGVSGPLRLNGTAVASSARLDHAREIAFERELGLAQRRLSELEGSGKRHGREARYHVHGGSRDRGSALGRDVRHERFEQPFEDRTEFVRPRGSGLAQRGRRLTLEPQDAITRLATIKLRERVDSSRCNRSPTRDIYADKHAFAASSAFPGLTKLSVPSTIVE